MVRGAVRRPPSWLGSECPPVQEQLCHSSRRAVPDRGSDLTGGPLRPPPPPPTGRPCPANRRCRPSRPPPARSSRYRPRGGPPPGPAPPPHPPPHPRAPPRPRGPPPQPPRGSGAVQRSDAFQDIRRSYRSFVFPVSGAFLGWFLMYVAAQAAAPGLMRSQVAGPLNVAWLLGLLQFASTFLLTWLYARNARTKRDRAALGLRWDTQDQLR
ncbi:DUF485 domain-containing protein [Kitasatospora sp. NPDC059803]|uniref:DUF485 domain-containing protein n=1 Tax=Kitasatospora sp. NPDC059803 TaxID=3346953 RepID=UPI0036469449